jgi:hypothetical protein
VPSALDRVATDFVDEDADLVDCEEVSPRITSDPRISPGPYRYVASGRTLTVTNLEA